MATLKCCVSGCDATSATHRLFNIPKDDKFRRLWLQFLVPTNPLLVGLSKEQLIRKSVCHRHFEIRQLDRQGRRTRYSYPCLFTAKEIEYGMPLSSEDFRRQEMSIDMKRSWAKELEDAPAMKTCIKSNNSSRDSSNSSNNRKKTKPNPDLKTRQRTLGKPREMECDPSILQRRQKQIDYGKNTVGYHNYTKLVPFDHRSKQHPKTPDKYTKYSRRSWDMMIKLWRKELHTYDQSGEEYIDEGSDSIKSESIKDEDEDYDNIEVIIDESDLNG